MNRLISIIIIVIIINFYLVVTMFGNTGTGNYLFDTDSIKSVDDKIEYLIVTSQELKQINSSLSYDAVIQACELAVDANNAELLNKCNHLKGIILSQRGETIGSLLLLKEVLAYYESIDDKTNAPLLLFAIGNTYYNNNQFTKASLYFNSALADFVLSSDSLNIVACYTYIGMLDAKQGNNNKAKSIFMEAIEISKNNGYSYFTALNYLELSKLQMPLLVSDTSLYQINTALLIAENNNFTDLISNAYLQLANYYTLIGNRIQASNQFEKYINYKDSLNHIKTLKHTNFLVGISNIDSIVTGVKKINIWYWIAIIVLIAGIIFIIFRIKTIRSGFDNQIYIITKELEAYEENSDELDETIELKTTERINEIENEISKNKNIVTALNESLSNLNHVNNLKDIFLSKISHEIRTPLSGILGFSEILETELALLEDNSLFEFANNISQSGQSLVLLLNNILDISRLDSNNMMVDIKQYSTTELIQGVVDSHLPEASLKGLKLIYANDVVPDIYTDSHIFTKIISLILNNAIKFTEKGFIKISHYHDIENDNIIFSIKDTGIGIDKVYLDQVFMPFRQESLGYSTSYQGAGLGLPLAKKMSLKLNGDIKIESEKGSGTTIILSFPAFNKNHDKDSKAVDIEPIVKPTVNKLPWEELSVLVVEDDNMNQILYRKLLKTSRVLEIAKDGKTALAMVENQIENNNFQLVLMDINLPSPWDGISLMNEIRNKWPNYNSIPFIAQTAYAISGNRELMLEEGFDEYITKPIIKSALIKTIGKVV